MDDFDIEILEEGIDSKGAIQLPLNFLSIGEIENDDVKVYIRQDVYKELEKYALSDMSHELGTIILGDYADELGKIHVIVNDYIIAKYTDASESTLTFTHQTWEYIHKEHETRFAKEKIIGWQHTHPGYGIFLSNYDMFIQENFFNLPFQIAYVIDPIQHLRGFFQWKNGRIQKLKGFYIFDDVGKRIKIEQDNKKEITEESNKAKRSLLIQPIILGTVFLVSVSLGVMLLFLSTKISEQSNNLKEVVALIENQNIKIQKQQEEISNLKETMENQYLTSDEKMDTEVVEESEDEINENSIVKDDTYEEKDSDNPYVLWGYIVRTGDSLMKICEEHNIDYGSTYRVILSLNGIEDPNQIYVGQMILLPIIR